MARGRADSRAESKSGAAACAAPPLECHVAGEANFCNLMRARVARHDQPRAIALLVEPQLLMQACGVIAQVLIVVESLCRAVGLTVRTVDQGGVAEVDKFCRIARPKQGVIDDHGAAS